MGSAAVLQPTLWRTCRVLANRTRLKMFGLLLRQPDQTVTMVARRFHLSKGLTSLYLRAMEARGLLAARRTGRFVRYRPGPRGRENPGGLLTPALRAMFQDKEDPVAKVFQSATAFTHPRRIRLFFLLQHGSRSFCQLRTESRMSSRSLARHLVKLQRRGFIERGNGGYTAVRQSNKLNLVLARMALKQCE